MTSERIEKYLMGMSRAPRTILHHYNGISKFCRWLMTRDNPPIDVNPAPQAREVVPRAHERLPRYLTEPQIKMLLDKAEREGVLYAEIVFALGTGVRLGELRNVRWENIHETPSGWAVEVGTKTFVTRLVPIPAEVRTVLEGLPRQDDDLLFRKRDKRWWGQTMARLTKNLPMFGELPGRSAGNQWHLLRSTFAVRQARAGATVWQLTALLGHRDVRTTQRYVNIAYAAGGPPK